jgi:hypothetical protein
MRLNFKGSSTQTDWLRNLLRHVYCFFCFYAGSGSVQIQNIESLKRLYSVRWGGNKCPRRPLGVNYSVEACSHCVKVGLVVLLLKRELDSLTECLRWWWSGWAPLLVTTWVWVNFLQKRRKILGSKNSRLSASNFRGLARLFFFFWWNNVSHRFETQSYTYIYSSVIWKE